MQSVTAAECTIYGDEVVPIVTWDSRGRQMTRWVFCLTHFRYPLWRAFWKIRRATVSFVVLRATVRPSFCLSASKNWVLTWQISIKFSIWGLFESRSRKI